MTRAAAAAALAAAFLAAFSLGGRSARADETCSDSLHLKDGRFVDGIPIERADGGLRLKYPSGDVFVPSALVADYVATSAAGDVEARDEEERAKLEKGLVPFEGKWVPKARRDAAIKERTEQKRKQLEELKSHREWRNRYKKETKHFAFEHTIPPEIAQSYMDLLETYYDVFTKKWNIRPGPKTGKLPVCIYSDRKAFNRVSGAPYGVIGYFKFVDPKELDLYYDRLDERLTIDVLFHEGNHYLTHLIDPKFNYPAWVNESLAEYYGASQWDSAKREMSVGHIQEGRLVVIWDAIAGEEWLGLEEMIRIDRFSAIHYAWGWSFVHFLMETPAYASKFQKFYIGLAKDKGIKRVPWAWDMVEVPPDEQIKALRSYLGVKDLKALEKEWHDYIRNTLKIEGGRGFEKAGDWARTNGLEIKAKRFYEKAIELGSTNPLTHHNFGRMLIDKHEEIDRGIGLVRKAVELDPLNARFYATLAQGLKRKGGEENEKEAERLKQLAVEIDPDDYSLQLDIEDVFKD